MSRSQNVHVFLRLRPSNIDHLPASSSVVQIIDQNSVTLDNRGYKFDRVTNEPSLAFFEDCLKIVISELKLGHSAFVLTYGQSQTGKTHTLFGDDKEIGIVQRIISQIFQTNSKGSLKISFFELFQETVFDLLQGGSKSDDYEEELNEVEVENYEKASELIYKANKRTGGKAHTIFVLRTECSKIVFADLSGVERNTSGCFNGERIKENTFINKSLASLSNVFKSIGHKSTFVNYKESKLTWLLKDCFEYQKIILLACAVPSRKSYWENLNTLKFTNKVSKLKSVDNKLNLSESFEMLREENKKLSESLESFREVEDTNARLLEAVKSFELQIGILNEKCSSLEEENSILRKEILEMNKIDTSDWLLSSDSEDTSGYFILTKEKSELESNLYSANDKILILTKELNSVNEKLVLSQKDLEMSKSQVNELSKEIDETKKKTVGYQELSVLLSKQNYDLINDLSKSKEICNEYFNDLSNMSSADSSKYEVHKIIEEKDAKLASLLETCKINEDSLSKLKEKHSSEINTYKKELGKLRQELAVCRNENIRENEEAMKVLSQLKQEKNKMMRILDLFSENNDKRKIVELKQINEILIENLKNKGEKVSKLEMQFKEFLKEYKLLAIKLESKKEKLSRARDDIMKIKNHISKFKLRRYKIEDSNLIDCIKELLPIGSRGKSKSGSIVEFSKLNFSQY